MKLELLQNLRPELRLKMSPLLIQRIEILQLASIDLKELIQQELLENEALEPDRPADEKAAGEDGAKERAAEEQSADDDFDRIAALVDKEDEGGWRPAKRFTGDEDPKMEAMMNTASRPLTLQEHLKSQLALTEAGARIKELAEQIIFNINERGYLLFPLEEIRLSLEQESTLEEMEEALRLVQSLEPRGVGARSLQECLLLQIDDAHPSAPLLRRLVLNHMEDLSRNRLPKVARDLGVTVPTVQKLIHEIGQLDPIPGRSFRRDEIPYVVPDVVVELIEGRYEIRLEDGYYPRIAVSRTYLDMARNKELDPKLRKHLQGKIESAKWLIESIMQRKSTLLRVVTEIVEHQKDFLDHGSRMLKPLKMQDIADKIGIHVSTVSRAIADKYVQTHRGIFPLKFFFTGAARSSDGSVESRLSVKQKVKEIIEGEDKSRPLSDQDIVDKLKEQGLDIARRTVTKYRKALFVPSSRERRVY